MPSKKNVQARPAKDATPPQLEEQIDETLSWLKKKGTARDPGTWRASASLLIKPLACRC
ncbi:MAG TPA: hypothetical protein VNX88_08390 [Terriglobales bacterium]|jgi:hypothetical protein|nr:hypothetical protein [Terriglobales bacterium]